jgi:hypothetical protein
MLRTDSGRAIESYKTDFGGETIICLDTEGWFKIDDGG